MESQLSSADLTESEMLNILAQCTTLGGDDKAQILREGKVINLMT